MVFNVSVGMVWFRYDVIKDELAATFQGHGGEEDDASVELPPENI